MAEEKLHLFSPLRPDLFQALFIVEDLVKLVRALLLCLLLLVLSSPFVSQSIDEPAAPAQNEMALPSGGAVEALPASLPAQASAHRVEESGRAKQTMDREPVEAMPARLAEFAGRLVNGQAGLVVGVYVPGVLEMQVEQQPETQTLYVSSERDVATQFDRAALNGVIGLLAHNTSSGILFYQMEAGADVFVIYGDGRLERYRVETISEFQKLQTFDPMSDFIDQSSGALLSSTEVFSRFYSGDRRVTFQTCLERNGDPNWGLRFIEAYPAEDQPGALAPVQ